jgi:ATP:corrinoid adenosyltransferase
MIGTHEQKVIDSYAFLDQVQKICTEKPREAEKLIQDTLSGLAAKEEYQIIDEILATVDVRYFTTASVLEFLSVTKPMRNKLDERAGLYRRLDNYIGTTLPEVQKNQILSEVK